MVQRWIRIAVVLAAALPSASALGAGASRSCKYEASECVSGSAAVELVDGRVSTIELNVFYCGLEGRPGYSCTIESKRGDAEFEWTDAGNRTTLRRIGPFNDAAPDEVVVTVGRSVSIDLANAQSSGACGAGAELPAAIVVAEGSDECRVFGVE